MIIEVRDSYWRVLVEVRMADPWTRTAGVMAQCKRVTDQSPDWDACPSENECWQSLLRTVGTWLIHRKANEETFRQATGMCAGQLREAANENRLDEFCERP